MEVAARLVFESYDVVNLFLNNLLSPVVLFSNFFDFHVNCVIDVFTPPQPPDSVVDILCNLFFLFELLCSFHGLLNVYFTSLFALFIILLCVSSNQPHEVETLSFLSLMLLGGVQVVHG